MKYWCTLSVYVFCLWVKRLAHSSSKMPLNLHYFAYSPPCRAVLATAQRLGLKPNIVKVNLMKGEHMTPEFLKVRQSFNQLFT